MNHHIESTYSRVQDISTCSEKGGPEEDDSTLVSISSIDIALINHDILKQVEGIKRKGNRNITLGDGDNRQPLALQSRLRSTADDEKYPSRKN